MWNYCYFNQNNEMFHGFRYTANNNILPMVILTYCMAVPVPQLPVFPDSHKNLVKVSWLVRLYVMVLDRVYWHPNGVAFEWFGVWDNPVNIFLPAFWAHHLIVWNNRRLIFFSIILQNLDPSSSLTYNIRKSSQRGRFR